ncbi:MAG TPA: DUF5652 family protein [Patescibacteria group bacterium]
MYNYSYFSSITSSPFFYLLLAADLVLRGMALYKSARKGQTIWFVALLVINSVGILPIIYLLIQSSTENKQTVRAASTPAKKSASRKRK